MTRQAQLAAHSQLVPRGSTGAEGFVSKSPRFKSPPSPTALVSAPCCCDARAGIDSSLGIECRRPSWQIREGRRCRHRISEMLDKAQRRRQLRPQRRVVRLALHNRSLRLKHPLHPPPPRRCASPPQRRGEASPAPLSRPPPPRRRPADGPAIRRADWWLCARSLPPPPPPTPRLAAAAAPRLAAPPPPALRAFSVHRRHQIPGVSLHGFIMRESASL